VVHAHDRKSRHAQQHEVLGQVAGLLGLLASLVVATAPRAVAADVRGVAESSASWTNPATGTRHTFHWRFGVETIPTLYRYRSRTWCDYKLLGSARVDPRSGFAWQLACRGAP
jgi:hypothetical protein